MPSWREMSEQGSWGRKGPSALPGDANSGDCPSRGLCFCMSGFQCASQAQNCYIDLSTFNKNTFCVNKSRVLAGGRCFGYHTLSSSHVPGRRELMPKGVKHMKTVMHVTVVNPLLGSPRNLCLREDIAKGKRWEAIIKII